MQLRFLPSFVSRHAQALGMALVVAVFALPLLFLEPGNAQSNSGGNGLGIDQIEQMLKGRLNSSQGTGNDQSDRSEVILQPSAPSDARLPTSRLEQIMSERAGIKLRQFGYDQFGIGRPVAIPQMGAVQDDYVLGPGDEIDVSLRGRENAEYQATVDRNGQVVLPLLSPISAAGRTFGEFRQDLLNAVRRAYVSTQAFVSISQLRQINVLVTGEIANPGARILTGLSTPVDAIVVSGGVKKTGSLRAIRIVRGGRTIRLDLYSLITQHGAASTLHLTDGDRIVVPPLGRTVAASGWVRLPGIYELAPGASAITVSNLASLAGGFEVQGKYRMSVLRLAPDGQSHMATVDKNGSVKDGEILYVQRAAEQITNQAELAGGVALAGRFPITSETRLSDVIKQPGALGTSPDTTFGIISRRDPKSYIRGLIAFTPAAVLNGTEDFPLQTGDVVRVFSTAESRMLRHAMLQFRQYRSMALEAQRDPQGLLPNQTTNGEETSSDSDFLEQLGRQQESLNPNPPIDATTGNPVLPFTGSNNAPFSFSGMGAPNQTAGGSPYPGYAYPSGGNSGAPSSSGTNTGGGYPVANSSTGAIPTLNSGNTGSAYPGASISNGNNPGAYPNPPNAVLNYSPNGGRSGAAALAQNYAGSQFGTSTMQGASSPDVPLGTLSNVPPANLEEQNISGTQVPTNEEAVSFLQASQQLSIEPIILANFLLDHVVILSGAVRGPGVYFAGPALTLDTLIAVAGGASNWADESSIDVISTGVERNTGIASTKQGTIKFAEAANYTVKPRDEFRVHEVYADAGIGSVTVQGELRHVGTYHITRGEHLSQLLIQAGGLTDVAYPYGTIFLRRSAASLEAQGYQRAADEVQSQLIGAMTRVTSSSTNRLAPNDFSALQTFVTQLRTQKPLGRISVVADPSLLLARPNLDPLLEPGDVIYIPQRPSTVTVLGQVLQPGSFPYEARTSVEDYLEDAGGYAQYADESMTFVVLPNGKAEKVETSWLNVNSQEIPPGSTIVVPRDLRPYDSRQLILDVTQIMSQLAISAASLAVLSRN